MEHVQIEFIFTLREHDTRTRRTEWFSYIILLVLMACWYHMVVVMCEMGMFCKMIHQ